jgi:inorganic pyrophosphatase/exopolyphosphatase
MKRLFFSLIISISSAIVMAGNLNTVQNQDSTILFDNITDISRQIEQRTANRNESQVDTIINIQNDDIILQDLNKQNDSIEVETDYDQLQEAEQQEQPEKTEQTRTT